MKELDAHLNAYKPLIYPGLYKVREHLGMIVTYDTGVIFNKLIFFGKSNKNLQSYRQIWNNLPIPHNVTPVIHRWSIISSSVVHYIMRCNAICLPRIFTADL